ncbi:MAG TPA: efflux RND transporter permease subunit [Verrucomicrobiae bacterium]|nr:efflux RND transporter permease subunit [Verrucomicrobiae bacterium]
MTGRKKTIVTKEKDKMLAKFTTFFFDRPRITAILWLVVAVFGVASYTTLLKREGFPSVQIPIAIVTGTYVTNDPAKVDAEAAKPLAEIALKQANVNTVTTQSSGNFFSTSIQYKEGTDTAAAAKTLEQAVKDSGKLPASARLQYNVPYFGATGGDIRQIDIAVSFYSKKTASEADLNAKATQAATWLQNKKIPHVHEVFVKSPLESVADPSTGQAVTIQRSFDRYGKREGGQAAFYNSVIVGMSANKGTDVIKLDHDVRQALQELMGQPGFQDYGADVSASFAPSIEENLSELQRVLLEGLLAVLIVGSIVIAIRASLITVISMITVLVASIAFLYAVGYSLNVITLFALILGLALIVDDTIIMVEAIDAARAREKDPRKAVQIATRKVSRAMVAATLTASLSFAPLLFVGGILGSFIRAIPITIIASLLISLVVALVFIPFFARFLLLGKKQMGKQAVKEVAAGFEAKLAQFIAKPMLWARHSKPKLFGVGITAVLIGLAFIGAGGAIARHVVFNIFPPTKDTNGLVMAINFPAGTTIGQAEAIAGKADELTKQIVGDNFVQASYYGTGSAQTGTLFVQLTPYNKRDIRSPEIVKQVQDRFTADFKEAQVAVGQQDVGPPSASFVVQIDTANRGAAFRAAKDLAAYLSTVELKRLDNSTARMKNVTVASADEYVRVGNKSVVQVQAGFDGTDTTTLVNLAQEAVKDKFGGATLASYGLANDAIHFELGQEAENQESFNALLLAFPVLLAAMYVLLAVQFRSLLQPLLIFLAIPFSFFGIMLGLNLTDNAISFFAMLGFFALIGLSIKNTILLTDFANQARRAGADPIDAAVAALEERFRPLFATSMTAVVSLVPLAIASPFWEGLAVVLIFGLLSSTLLVVTVFPYYYLGSEYLRLKFKRRHVVFWLIALIGGVIALSALEKRTLIGLWLLICALYPIVYVVNKKHVLPRVL